MSCHNCTKKFGFLQKEHGCPSCGFSFCSSCLKFKCQVPKLGGSQHKVCKKCFTAITSASDTSRPTEQNQNMDSFVPPDVFFKRLEELDNPSRPPITVYHTKPRLQDLVRGLNSTDLEIARRLERLREDRHATKELPSEEEMARRLAVLRNQDPDIMTKPNAYTPPETRSAVLQADDLMNQATEEISLDKKQSQIDDTIEQRLAVLRDMGHQSSQNICDNVKGTLKVGENSASNAVTLDEVEALLAQCKLEAARKDEPRHLATIVSLEQLRCRLTEKKKELMGDFNNADNDDAKVQEIVSKAQDEIDIERRLGISTDSDEEMNEEVSVESEEELPWCVICNEDAVVRCKGCDGELYCAACFKEGHKDEDMRNHGTEPFKKQRK